jgi:nucleoid DNA-binding protein
LYIVDAPQGLVSVSTFREGTSMTGKKSAKGRTKSDTFKHVAETTNLSRKQVAAVFDTLIEIVKEDLGKKGPGVFTIPGLLKIKRIHKPATPERQGINPFTKEPTVFKAKPARNVVKAQALKSLKEMVK